MSVFEDTASASFEVCRVNKGTKFGKGGSTFRLHDFFGKTGDENEFYRSLDRLEAAAKISSYIQSSYEETVGDMLKKLTLALDGEIDKVMEQWDNEGNETEKQVPTFGLNFGMSNSEETSWKLS
ncbi:unnamed protein product [Notodromas monacha]|uniref:Uncharacterized protein n=1 Tax=Notodromas monacha TaxID=399045 RepID=A0A7R9G8A9_9CRUS|nr:unnamed protein product [Notodromas monacha]CAG0912953.1 unnamed protein product [Notodromas monacha]